MTKKIVTGLWFLCVLLIFSACNNSKGQAQKDTIKVNSCRLILDTDLLETAKKGQLKGISVNLSSSKSKLEESYGKPDETGFYNADYLKYDNCYFYIWDEDKIGVIDIKINFTVEKVREVLGKPDFEGKSDAGFDEYVLGYKAEENYLYFKYKDKDSTTGVLRFKKI